jgi:hypothetical protein
MNESFTTMTPNQRRVMNRQACVVAVIVIIIVVVTTSVVLTENSSSNDTVVQQNVTSSSSTGGIIQSCVLTAYLNNTYNPEEDTTNLYAVSASQCNATAQTTPGALCLSWFSQYPDTVPPCTEGEPCCWIGMLASQCTTVLSSSGVWSGDTATANVTCT